MQLVCQKSGKGHKWVQARYRPTVPIWPVWVVRLCTAGPWRCWDLYRQVCCAGLGLVRCWANAPYSFCLENTHLLLVAYGFQVVDIQCGQGVLANDIQQDCCAFVAFEAMKNAFVAGEGAVDDGYLFARVENLFGPSLKTFVVFILLELFYQVVRDLRGYAIECHQATDTVSGADRRPVVGDRIQGNEQVTGEARFDHGSVSTALPAGLGQQGEVDFKALAFEIGPGQGFVARLGVNQVPVAL